MGLGPASCILTGNDMAPLLVDLDLDFFFNDPQDWTLARDKTLWPGGNEVLAWVGSLEVKQRALVIDHHEVLHHWDLHDIKKAFCLHIDAHHDAFAKEANAWRRPLGSRGQMVGVGDFIFQALREDIIGQLLWWTPPAEVASDSSASLQKLVGPRLGRRIQVQAWPHVPTLEGPADLLSVSVSPEWLNPGLASWLRSALQQLGFRDDEVARALKQANARWQLLQAHTEHMTPFRYRFPEAYR